MVNVWFYCYQLPIPKHYINIITTNNMADNNFKASFNDSLGLIQQIDGLLNSATRYYIDNELSMAWRTLKAIQSRIIQLCSTEEVLELNKVAEQSGSYIQASKFEIRNIDTINKALYYYEKYNELIMRKLHDSHLLLQSKKDASKMNF